MIDNYVSTVEFEDATIVIGRMYGSIRMIVYPSDGIALGLELTPQMISKIMGEIKFVGVHNKDGRELEWTNGEDDRYTYTVTIKPDGKEMMMALFSMTDGKVVQIMHIKDTVDKFGEFYHELMKYRSE